MPTLKEYVPDSQKNGCYVLAYNGGEAPDTLQVDDLAEVLLKRAGYYPGDTVPSKIVWSMYEIGLLYTGSQLSQPNSSGKSVGDPHRLISDLELDNTLAEDERTQLIACLKEYDGPGVEKVAQLIKMIQKIRIKTHDPTSEKGWEHIERSDLDKWVMNEEVLNQLMSSNSNFLHFSLCSLVTFKDKRHLKSQSITVHDDYSIEYSLTDPKYRRDISLKDYRFHMNKGYQITINHGGDNKEIITVSVYGNLKDYTNDAGRKGSFLRAEALLNRIIPTDPVEYQQQSAKWESVDTQPSVEKSRERLREAFSIISSDIQVGHSDRFNQTQIKALRSIEPDIDNSNISVGIIDRVSNGGNPVVELGGEHIIVNEGEIGDKFIIYRPEPDSQNGKCLVRLN